MKDFNIAHVRKNQDCTWAEPQGLQKHLEGTAKLAEEFARVFDSGAWGDARNASDYDHLVLVDERNNDSVRIVRHYLKKEVP